MVGFRFRFLTYFVFVISALSACLCLAQAPRIVGHWTGLSQSDVGDGVTGELFTYGGSYYYDIGVDTMGRPNLVWAASTLATVQANGVVKFAYWDGAIWRGMENPDGPDSLGLGNSCQLVNLPTGPAVIYDSATITVITELRYVLWNGTAWQQDLSTATAQIQSREFRVCLDGLGRPHFLYIHYENPESYLYYSFWNGTSLEGLGGSDEGEGLGSMKYSYGVSSISFALDSRAFPHIVYYPGGPGAFYALWDGSAWQRVLLSDIFGFSSSSPRIAIDAQDHPHITLPGYTSSEWWSDLYYAYWDGQEWVLPNRDAGGVSQAERAWSPGVSDMAIDLYGNANIAYMMGAAIYLRYCPSGGAEFLSCGFGDIGWGVVPPPEYKADWGQIDMFSGPEIAVSREGRAYVAYVTKFIVGAPGGLFRWEPVCRVRAFMPEPAPYPLLALDTTKRAYDMSKGDSAVSLVLGVDNQLDEWADTDFYLAVREKQKPYRFGWWGMYLPLPPNWYFPPATVITLPITPGSVGGIFSPPTGYTYDYIIYGGFFTHGTGDALGPIQWNQIWVRGE